MDNLGDAASGDGARTQPASVPVGTQSEAEILYAIPFPARRGRGPTVLDLVELYCRLELPELAPRPQRQRRAMLDAFAAEFGNCTVDDLHKSDLKRWLKAHKEWKADDSKRNVCNGVKRLFSWALDDERIDRNPFASVSWPASKPRRPMRDSEFVTIIRVAEPKFKRMFYLLLWTGMRPDELARLEWPMIDFDRCRVVLEEHKTRKVTGESRKIYLHPFAVRLLRWLHLRRLSDGPVFLNRRGKPFTSKQICDNFARFRRLTDLPADCKLYGLRHKFGTDSQVSGNDIKTTAELMGHSSTRTTEKYYVDLSEEVDFLKAAAARVGRKKNR